MVGLNIEGGSVEEIRPGDVVWFAPGKKPWHGATPTIGMTHIAIQEKLEGKVVDWLEHVTDEQYGNDRLRASGYPTECPIASIWLVRLPPRLTLSYGWERSMSSRLVTDWRPFFRIQ